MSAYLQFTRTGAPLEVLELQQRDLAPLRAGEVRVAMRYAPINPADFNYIEGSYGRAANPPAIPGNEGCGEVIEVGSEVTSLEVGDFVIPLHPGGIWSQHVTAPEGWFAKLPPNIDLVQASMLRVNPATAWRLLHDFVNLVEGEVIAQNAANSGVGRALIQIAKKLGFQTLNLVRRTELIAELQELGGTQVLLDDNESLDAARDFLTDRPLRLAANAVGGDSAIRLMDLLGQRGLLVTYGAMGGRALKVPNGFLIFKDLTLKGLWVSEWYEKANRMEVAEVLRALSDMMIEGTLRIAVDCVVPLRDFRDAIDRARQGGRDGKVILDLSAAD